MLFCKHYFSPLNTFMRKGKDPEPDPDPRGTETFDPVDPDPQHCNFDVLQQFMLTPWAIL